MRVKRFVCEQRAREADGGRDGRARAGEGAYDLCRRATVGRHSRHVERKVFKMRELRFAGKVKVELVPTKDNASDMLTKALDEQTFARHRDTIMNRKISES